MKLNDAAALTRSAGKGRRFALVVSDFNRGVTGRLAASCRETLMKHGAAAKDISETRVPGAFELPLACQTLARTKRFSAVIALGCIIRGETPHDRYLAKETARGLGQAALDTGVPVIFGVLTPLNVKQANARANKGPLDKGREAALAALHMAGLMPRLKRGK